MTRPGARKALLISLPFAILAMAIPFAIWCLKGGLEKELFPSYPGLQSGWVDIHGPLIQTRWKQDGAYAALTPSHNPLGCWSVAFAQVLAYHRLQPAGRVSYRTRGGLAISEMLRPVDWNHVVPDLAVNATPEASRETARYCYDAAVILQKDFGRGEYMDVTRVPQEIAEHYGCRVERASFGVQDVVKSELHASRPLVAYFDDILAINHSIGFKLVRVGHAAVLDGTAEDDGRLVVHVNFGWAGRSDGWYDFKKLARERELLYVFRVLP